MAGSKTAELVEAARKRREIEQANATPANVTTDNFANWTDEQKDAAREAAVVMAEGQVQAKNGTVDGKIDVEAMGDVKGDGGDAKDYDDDDPAKALGVPTYVHGLHETRGGVDVINAVTEPELSPSVKAEQEAGRAALSGRGAPAKTAPVVTAREVGVTPAEADKIAADKIAADKAAADAKAAKK